MEVNDNKEQVVMMKPHQDDDNEKNKKKQRFVIKTIIIAGSLLLVAIIVIILAVFLIRKKNKDRKNNSSDVSSSETYNVDPDTEARCNNLLTYLNNEYHDIPTYTDEISNIESFSIIDGHLLVLAHNEAQMVYFDIDYSGDILYNLKNGVPSVGAYPIIIQVEYHNSGLIIDVENIFKDCSNFKLKITDYESNHYVSFMGMKSEEEAIALTHGDYLTSGEYEYMTISSKNDKPLFDLYYYLLNEIK